MYLFIGKDFTQCKFNDLWVSFYKNVKRIKRAKVITEIEVSTRLQIVAGKLIFSVPQRDAVKNMIGQYSTLSLRVVANTPRTPFAHICF